MSQRKLKKIRKEEKILGQMPVNPLANLSLKRIIKENWKIFLYLTLGVILVFANGMNGDFVSDDYATIPQNPYIADAVKSWQDKPNIVNYSNTITALLFGINSPAPYHLFNLGLMIAVTIEVFVFTYLLMGKPIAVIASVIFAVLPIHVEGITWISGRPYSMFTMITLAMLIAIVRYLNTRKTKFLVVIAILLFIDFWVDKARMLGLAILIPFCLIYFFNLYKIKINWTKVVSAIIGVGVVTLIIVWPAIKGRINVVNSGYNASESIFYNPFFQYPTSVAKYLQLLFLPFDLTLYHTMYVFPVWLNWAIFISYLSLVIYFLFKDKRISFALAFIFVATAPSMAPVKVAWLVAERYIFFGTVGFSIFMAILLNKLGKLKYLQWGIISLMVILFSARLMLRNDNWNTNHNLWVNTCQVSPNSHNAWNNIGDDYDKLKQYDNAIKGFTQSTVIKPNYADAFHNRANIFFKIGRLDLARDSYMIALHYSPTLYQTYLSLINIDLMEKKMDLALEHAKKSMELQPGNAQAAYVLAVVHLQRGEVNEGAKILEEIVIAAPNFTQAKDLLTQIKTGSIK